MSDKRSNPNHVAIIMDGNARWAKLRGLPVKLGHQRGAQNIINITKAAIDNNIKFLTLYAFSTENWQRPKKEIKWLMDIMNYYLENKVNEIINLGVRIRMSGNLSRLDEEMQNKIKLIEKKTINNSAIQLIIAFNYGGRQEILDVIKKIVIQDINPEKIDEKLFEKNLYINDIPSPDLLIRTSGEKRISNFLLWQIAYSELYFTKTLWPSFSKRSFVKAIENYKTKNRRYGKRQ